MTEKPELKATALRIPDELRRYLKHKAIDHHRSLNSEIIARLEQTRQQEGRGKPQ